MTSRAWSRESSQFAFNHSLRKLPLKLSMKAFWVGVPGLMECNVTPRS